MANIHSIDNIGLVARFALTPPAVALCCGDTSIHRRTQCEPMVGHQRPQQSHRRRFRHKNLSALCHKRLFRLRTPPRCTRAPRQRFWSRTKRSGYHRLITHVIFARLAIGLLQRLEWHYSVGLVAHSWWRFW